MKNARAERAKLSSLALNMQICDVLVDVAVVVAKAPCCQVEGGKELYENEKRTCRACRALVFVH